VCVFVIFVASAAFNVIPVWLKLKPFQYGLAGAPAWAKMIAALNSAKKE
jgi:hypothetical protein